MMLSGLHDRVSGHANRVRVLAAFLLTRPPNRASGSPERTKLPLGRLNILTSRQSMNAARAPSQGCLAPRRRDKPARLPLSCDVPWRVITRQKLTGLRVRSPEGRVDLRHQRRGGFRRSIPHQEMTLKLQQLIRPLRFVLASIAAIFCIASLHGVATNPVPAWTIVVIVVLLGMMVGGQY